MSSKQKSVKCQDGMIAGLYDLVETIGKGHYAVVKLARHVFTGEKVAVKVIDKMKLDEISRAHLFQEVRCMKLVQHPHVVRLYEVIDTATKLYLVLEWGDGGDMYDYIMRHDRGLDEPTARRYFAQIVQAIDYCHQLHVVHRDLKPENVVFFETEGGGIVKLTDFGFSNKFVPGRKLETSCGSLAYSAPEILLGDSYDAPAVDIWSLGVILYMLVCGEPPFQEANDSETLTMIMDCKYRMPDHVSPLCQDIIGRMLVREPADRASLADISRHPWMFQGDLAESPIADVPLVCRESITEDDNSQIIQRIVEGKIATKEEIMSCLESSAYNHITATYYLLAERLLRKRKESSSQSSNDSERSKSGQKPVLSPLALSPRSRVPPKDVHGIDTVVESLLSPLPPVLGISSFGPPTPSLHSEIGLLGCRYSLIHEDSAESGPNDIDGDAETTTITQSYSDSELAAEEEGSELGELARSSVRMFSGLVENQSSSRSASKQSPAIRPLVSVRSSPQLLNEICEEAEHGDEDDHSKPEVQHPSGSDSRRNSGGDRLPRHRDRMHHRIHHRTLTPRVTSCSSSDTSDTDEVDPKGTKQKTSLTGTACLRNLGRRDSSEHSSDNDNLPSTWPSSCVGGDCRSCATVDGRPCADDGKEEANGVDKGGSNGGKQTGYADAVERDRQPDDDREADAGSTWKTHLGFTAPMSQERFDNDQYIPVDGESIAAPFSLSIAANTNNRISSMIRLRSMELGSLVETGKTKLKSAVKVRCHSTIDVRCGGTHVVAAALLAKLSCIDILERRSQSVSCLRARKVSM